MLRPGAVRANRSRIQLHRHHREAHGRQHALAMAQFPDHRRRKARPQSRHRVRRPTEDPRGTNGHVGSGLEVRLRRPRAANRRRSRQDGDDPDRAALCDAGDQSPAGPLRASHRTDCVRCEASNREVRRPVAFPFRPERPIRAIHGRRRRRARNPSVGPAAEKMPFSVHSRAIRLQSFANSRSPRIRDNLA